MSCPFCDSADVEEVSQWGGQIITRQMRCRACNTYFEAIRDEFADADAAAAGPLTPAESRDRRPLGA